MSNSRPVTVVTFNYQVPDTFYYHQECLTDGNRMAARANGATVEETSISSVPTGLLCKVCHWPLHKKPQESVRWRNI